MIALAHDETRESAEDENLLAGLVEKYAYVGADVLAMDCHDKSGTDLTLELTKVMSPAPMLDQI